MAGYQLEVRDRNGGVLSQGTGWFVSQDTVMTAFHVVGTEGTRLWTHQEEVGATYQVKIGSRWATLTPVESHPRADLAILRAQSPQEGATVLLLAEKPPELNLNWRALGYPADLDHAFTLTGRVVATSGDDETASLQLTVEQGTVAPWEG